MITFTEQELQNLLTFLGDVPSKYANPLISFFNKKIEEVKKELNSEEKKEKTK